MKVLIVDDSSAVRKIIKATTDMLQLEAEEAQDGIEALEKLNRNHDFGLILLDWNMPEMNGFDVLVRIKSNDKYRHIPVMMVTTEGQKTSIVAAIRAGADNYLTKPFTTDELITKIYECLGKEAGNI